MPVHEPSICPIPSVIPLPGEYGAMVERLLNTVPNADKAIFSVHCHNDLGSGRGE